MLKRLCLSLAALFCAAAAHATPLADGERHADLNGVRHWYRVAGAARHTPPLIIVHGGPGGNSYVFEHSQGPRLERFATVVYYDQRGGGRSDAPAGAADYAMPTLVSDLDRLVDELGAPKVRILGFSFGAELALEYALAHPDRLDRLVLQAPNAGDYARMARTETYAFQAAFDGEAKARLDAIAAQPLASPAQRLGQIWAFADKGFADRFQFHDAEAAALSHRLDAQGGFRNTGRMNAVMFADDRPRGAPLMDRAGSLAVPTLVVVGAYDRTTGVDVARDLAARIPRARFHVFEDSAHFPDMEEPERYAAVVEAFLRDGRP